MLIMFCEKNLLEDGTFQLTDYLNGLFVVEFFIPVEHPQERKGGEEDEAYAQEHVAGETGKIDPLCDTHSNNRHQFGCKKRHVRGNYLLSERRLLLGRWSQVNDLGDE